MGICVCLEASPKNYLPFEVGRRHMWVRQNMAGQGFLSVAEVSSGKQTRFDEGANRTEVLELFQLAAF